MVVTLAAVHLGEHVAGLPGRARSASVALGDGDEDHLAIGRLAERDRHAAAARRDRIFASSSFFSVMRPTSRHPPSDDPHPVEAHAPEIGGVDLEGAAALGELGQAEVGRAHR